MNFTVREYSTSDLSGMAKVWNCVVREGNAFPQTEELDLKSAAEFFEGQTFCGVAVDDNSGEVVGMYILHPNNIGRCGHICNASYALFHIVWSRVERQYWEYYSSTPLSVQIMPHVICMKSLDLYRWEQYLKVSGLTMGNTRIL